MTTPPQSGDAASEDSTERALGVEPVHERPFYRGRGDALRPPGNQVFPPPMVWPAASAIADPAADEKYLVAVTHYRRGLPIAAILVLLASIVAPWRVTPFEAAIVAFSLLGIVFFNAGLTWFFRYGQRRVTQVWGQILRRSNETLLTHGALSSNEVREAVEKARRDARHVRPWDSDKWFDVATLIPTWPIPSSFAKVIEDRLAFFQKDSLYSLQDAMSFAWWYLASSTAAFLLVWANRPAVCNIGARACSGAIAGLDAHPRVGWFPYLAFNAALGNTPSDAAVRSPAAHLVLVATWLASAILLGVVGTKLWARVRMSPTPDPYLQSAVSRYKSNHL
jgi:hypothetical protein